MARIVRSPLAEADALEIWTYIAADNVTAADRLLDRLDHVFHKLSTQPLLGKAVDAIVPGLRFFPVGNYLVFYRPIVEGVEIVRLLHGARDITADFFRD